MTLVQNTHNEVNDKFFVGGNLANNIEEWENITKDPYILEAILGYQIDFEENPQEVESIREYTTTPEEASILDAEIDKLLKSGVIEKSLPEPGQVCSPIFLRDKPDGSHRMILNLKRLNEDIEYQHFKMDTLETILNLVDENDFITTIDIKSAYYTVKIHPDYQKYLKFTHRSIMYKFICLPNGLSPAPRLFTKIMKPVLGFLRLLRVIVAIYIDDLINLHKSKETCALNTERIITLLEKLGFTINMMKSKLEPSKIAEFLGFVINTINMTVQLTQKKKIAITELCTEILNKDKVTIRQVAKLLGKFTSSCLGVKFGPLHYRYLDRDKTLALKKSSGKYNSLMKISTKGKQDILWWLENIMTSFNHIRIGNPTITITTDACFTGWGGTTGTKCTNGLWHAEELHSDIDINVLELKAILFSLQALLDKQHNTHIKVMSDNTTAVHSINNMGTCHSFQCHDVVVQIWDWAKDRNNWLTTAHIPGKLNVEADKLSRIKETSMEWKLHEDIFNKLINKFGFTPNIDLFATRINTQLQDYVSFQPDPGAKYVNAFTLDWGKFGKIYCFPPFSIIGKVIRKMRADKAEGILVTPNWTTQYWYPLLLEISKPYFISHSTRMLYLPNDREEVHPMKGLVLVAWRI